MRLEDGPKDRKYNNTNYEGRLEICHSGMWNTVCDRNISNTAAIVVCKQSQLPLNGEKEMCADTSLICQTAIVFSVDLSVTRSKTCE